MARMKSSLAGGATAATCGYILWCPDFVNTPGAGANNPTGFNAFTWSSATSNLRPLNTAVTPFGAGGPNTALAILDPASQLVFNGSTVAVDQRVHAACIQLSYVGTMANSAGEVSWISNLPLSQVLAGGPTATPTTVDELFLYSPHKQRMGIDTIENVYRLNELGTGSEIFRGEKDLLLELGIAPISATSVPDETEAQAPRLFGLVWRNVTASSAFTIDMVKIIEWRAKVTSGLNQVPIHSAGESLLPKVMAAIDQVSQMGNAFERVVPTVASAATTIASVAATGVRAARAYSGLRSLYNPQYAYPASSRRGGGSIGYMDL